MNEKKHWNLLVGAAMAASLLASPYVVAQGAAVRLSFEAGANLRFAADIRNALARTQEQLAPRLCAPLVAGAALLGRSPECPESIPPAAVVHAVVLRKGAVWRFFSSHGLEFESRRSLGSITKGVIAVPLLATHGAKPGERWCVHSFGGRRNADGFVGHAACAPAAYIDARAALAHSNNLATIWRLQQLQPAALREELSALQIGDLATHEDAASAIALGRVELAPREALECLDAIATGRARRAVMALGGRPKPTSLATWCAHAVASPAARRFVRELLSAPAEAGGTAAFLPMVLRGSSGFLAKTGTPATDQGLDVGKVLVASFQHGGARYSLFVAMLSAQPSRPLATQLASRDLVPILQVIARHIQGVPKSAAQPARHPPSASQGN